MKVECVRIPAPLDGMELESSPWVRLRAEYHVVSVLAAPGERVQLQLVTDDGSSLAWFDSACFRTTDGRLPRNWSARLHENGVLELAPLAWMPAGFWESYYDSDPDAIEAVSRELREILDLET